MMLKRIVMAAAIAVALLWMWIGELFEREDKSGRKKKKRRL